MHNLGCPQRNNPYADCCCKEMEQREHTEQLRRYNDNAERTVQVVTRDHDRIQCEQIATVIYNRLPDIMAASEYAGQVSQNVTASYVTFVREVADIIQKELGR